MSPGTLRMLVAFVLIGTLHSAWLFGAYGGGVLSRLGEVVHYNVVMFVWVGVSSALAAFAYFNAACRIGDVESSVSRIALCAGATLASLFLGAVLAFNSYGT